MRAWQVLACLSLCIAVSTAFSVSSHSAYSDSGDLEAAASGHGGGGHGGGGGGHGGGHESGFEEHGGSEFGEEHSSKVSFKEVLVK
jgi:hypothetical protein